MNPLWVFSVFRTEKLEQQIHYKVGQSLLRRGPCTNKEAALLQSVAGFTNWSKSCLNVGQVIYYKVGESFL